MSNRGSSLYIIKSFLSSSVTLATTFVLLLNATVLPTPVAAGVDGGIQVYIEPAAARDAGAMWRVRQEGSSTWSPWRESGYNDTTYTEPGVLHYIEFLDIAGWEKPNSFEVEISSDGYTTTRTYYPKSGWLQVKIQPYGARRDGIMWRRTGTTDWFPSGYTENNVPVGDHTVEFKEIAGWGGVSDQTVTIEASQTTTLTVTFVNQQGTLEVFLNPEQARLDGAKWSIDGISGVHSSGASVDLPAGAYTVNFSDTRGWLSPFAITVSVKVGQTTTKTALYSRLDVGKVRILADSYTINTYPYITAKGNVRLAFDDGSSAPPEASPTGWTDDFLKISSDVNVNLINSELSGNGLFRIKGATLPIIGDLPIYNGPYTINGNKLKITGISFLPAFKYLGYDLKIYYLQFLTDPFGVGFGWKMELNPLIYGNNSYIDVPKVQVRADGDIVLQGEVKVTDFSLFEGLMTLEGLHGFIDTQTVSFGITVDSLTIGEDLPSFGGSLIIKNKKLKEISGSAKDIGFQIPDTPIYWQDIGLSLKDPSLDQTKIALDTIAFTLFDRKEDWSAVEIRGNTTVDFSGHWAIGATISVLGWDLQWANLDLNWKQSLLADVRWFIPAFMLTVNGDFGATWGPVPFSPNWGVYLEGYIGFELKDWMIDLIEFFYDDFDETELYVAKGSVRAGKTVSGIICKANILDLFDVSYTIPAFWNYSAPPSLEVRGLRTARITDTSPAAASIFTVPQDSPAAIFVAEGKLGGPEVKLTAPDGTVYDTTGNLPDNSNDFIFIRNDEDFRVTFIIRNPAAGDWRLNVTNAGQTGDTNVFFVGGNNPPTIVPRKIEKLADNQIKLIASAFDPDETAEVKFYWAQSNETFKGILVGKAEENDGRLEFIWECDYELPSKTGYVYAEISDEAGATNRAFFPGKITIGQFPAKAPRFGKCKVTNDSVITKIKNLPKDGVEMIRVYYSGDTTQQVLTEYSDVKPKNKVTLTKGELNPGRRYQIRMAYVSPDGAESPLSKKRIINYIAKSENNYPYFTSTPATESSVGANYVYNLSAFDADGDALQYTLEEAPEGMALSGNSLTWTPGKKNAGLNFVTLKVSDGNGGEEMQQFSVMVASASVPTQTAMVDVIDTDEGKLLVVRVRDKQAGVHRTIRDSLTVTLSRKGGLDPIKLKLTETAGDSGVFQGTMLLDNGGVSAPAWLTSTGSSTVETLIGWKDRAGKSRRARSIVRSY